MTTDLTHPIEHLRDLIDEQFADRAGNALGYGPWWKTEWGRKEIVGLRSCISAVRVLEYEQSGGKMKPRRARLTCGKCKTYTEWLNGVDEFPERCSNRACGRKW